MTDREFRRLRRAELIEIIFKLQETEASLRSELASVKEQLEAKNLKLSGVGSIAEAAMSLNSVFESAQAAADQYVAQVKQLESDTEARTEEMLRKAQEQETEMISGAKRQCDTMFAEAEEKRSALLSEAEAELAAAKKQYDAMISEAQAKHDALISAAEQEVSQKWQELNEKVQRTVETYAELRGVMESLQERHG